MNEWPILSMIIFSPLLGILILLLIPATKGKAIRTVGILTTLIPLILSGWLYIQFDIKKPNMQFNERADWINLSLNKETLAGAPGIEKLALQFDYQLGVDGLSLPLLLLTALITSMAALASIYVKKRWKSFYILFLLLSIGMFGVFLATDLFLFFLFFELTLIPMFFLIGIWGLNNRERAANYYLLYNGIGSAVMLIAFLMLIATAGFSLIEQPEGTAWLVYSGDYATLLANLGDPNAYVNLGVDRILGNPFFLDESMRGAVFIMLLVAFGIKLPIFPFHTWMLKVHREANPAVVMIHAGILLKMGAYGLIRFGIQLFPEQAQDMAFILALLGVINILYGAILAIVQTELRALLAYSSISHMGIALLGLAAFNGIGLQGAVIQLVSHGLIAALMFLMVGLIYERTRTTVFSELGGLAKSLPFTSGILLIAGLASLGLPGLSGFVGEFLSLLALFQTHPVLTVFGALGIIFTAVYVLKGILDITFGSVREEHLSLRDARLSEVVPMIVLVAFILLIGIYPSIVNEPMQQTIQNMILRIGG